MAAGRPSDYTPEVAARICEQIADGKSIREVCEAEDMPVARTVWRWLAANPEFSQNYVLAKEESAESFADEIVGIADETPQTIVGRTGKGEDAEDVFGIDSAGIQRNRLRVDARKWVASKLLPKKYGDKLGLDVTGELSIAGAVNRIRDRVNDNQG